MEGDRGTKSDGKSSDEETIEAVWQKGRQNQIIRHIAKTNTALLCRGLNTEKPSNGVEKSITSNLFQKVE
jgi:hypothetical protein